MSNYEENKKLISTLLSLNRYITGELFLIHKKPNINWYVNEINLNEINQSEKTKEILGDDLENFPIYFDLYKKIVLVLSYFTFIKSYRSGVTLDYFSKFRDLVIKGCLEGIIAVCPQIESNLTEIINDLNKKSRCLFTEEVKDKKTLCEVVEDILFRWKFDFVNRQLFPDYVNKVIQSKTDESTEIIISADKIDEMIDKIRKLLVLISFMSKEETQLCNITKQFSDKTILSEYDILKNRHIPQEEMKKIKENEIQTLCIAYNRNEAKFNETIDLGLNLFEVIKECYDDVFSKYKCVIFETGPYFD
jgi:hypothetical protein